MRQVRKERSTWKVDFGVFATAVEVLVTAVLSRICRQCSARWKPVSVSLWTSSRAQDDPPCPGRRQRPRPARSPESPDGTAAEQRPEPEAAVILYLPGLLADHLHHTGDAAGRKALQGGRTIRRGQSHSVRVTAPLALHEVALKQCAALAGDGSTPAGRKAYRAYADRIAAVMPTT